MIRVQRSVHSNILNILLLAITKFETDKGPKEQTKIIDAPVTNYAYPLRYMLLNENAIQPIILVKITNKNIWLGTICSVTKFYE